MPISSKILFGATILLYAKSSKKTTPYDAVPANHILTQISSFVQKIAHFSFSLVYIKSHHFDVY